MAWRMFDLHLTLKSAHIIAGATAVVLGPVPLLARKGSWAHRMSGRLFVLAGSVCLACAALAALLYPQPVPLVAATLLAGYQFVGGLRALPRFGARPGAFDAGFALAAATLGVLLVPIMSRGSASWPPVVGWTMLGWLSAVVTYDLSRHLWSATWRRAGRPLDHGLKLTGAYFGMASAGAGNLLHGLQPWGSIAPSIIGTLVMVLLAVNYVRRRRAAHAFTATTDIAPDTAAALN